MASLAPLSGIAADGVGTEATAPVLGALSAAELCDFGRTSVMAAMPTRQTSVTDTAATANKG